MSPYSRPRQPPPASRGSKLGYYRASIACVGCRRSKTRCLLTTPRRELQQDSCVSCVSCRRKNKPCVFLTVDKKPPDWVWSKPQRGQTAEVESKPETGSSSSPPSSYHHCSVSVPLAGSVTAQDCTQSDAGVGKQQSAFPPQQHGGFSRDMVEEQSFLFETLFPPDPPSHVFSAEQIDGYSGPLFSLDQMGGPEVDPSIPQYASSWLSVNPESGWDINISPTEYPDLYIQDPLQHSQFHAPFDQAAVTLETAYEFHEHYFQFSGQCT
ncbi:hypothetical protein Z517_06241 [Fonsecaea pedrosoi CBS 271.37]|uniref:Zn(2)-C6 fungal-type domain-containing protein n=1 Tax=Fonsecaea pedrosoi CBS 271.37 TaxID=1442368 RepID=A0A0D2EZ59_9EURO|nr:uncharacterized protein Z517_06241 [Fonsecaea pedrosoi CBS 271.37]KIW79627.1 hypothetical protein Z517_06241 [Fonsecaea pedrosoi CBS 271.37]